MNKKLCLTPCGDEKHHLELREEINCRECPSLLKTEINAIKAPRLLVIEKRNDHCAHCTTEFLNLINQFDEVAYLFDDIRDDKSWRHSYCLSGVCKKFARFIDLDDALAWLGKEYH